MCNYIALTYAWIKKNYKLRFIKNRWRACWSRKRINVLRPKRNEYAYLPKKKAGHKWSAFEAAVEWVVNTISWKHREQTFLKERTKYSDQNVPFT